ncbi:PIN domain-containing protein [Facklamia sp. P13069]|uniref:PIN domain-containing protein n=1 Tax=Facklamia sp. P13069 TaxID=3421954 RepID=UPI003D16CBA1
MEGKEELEFPLNVFVDTQIFESQSFDISDKSRLGLLKKQVKKGAINFLTSEIIVGEANKHIKENVKKKQ